MTILYINNEHCKDFAHLKNYFKNHLSNSDIYAELLEDSRDGEITKFLEELGEQELVSLIGTIDQNLCDHDYMNQLTAIITGNKQSIKKPHYSKFFILEKASYKRKNKEVTVSLKINILEHVNEDYVIHIVTSFGFDAIKINTSKIDDDSITEHISFPNCKEEFSGNIKIDDEKVISNIPNINRPDTNENHQSITSNTTYEKKLPLVKNKPNTTTSQIILNNEEKNVNSTVEASKRNITDQIGDYNDETLIYNWLVEIFKKHDAKGIITDTKKKVLQESAKDAIQHIDSSYTGYVHVIYVVYATKYVGDEPKGYKHIEVHLNRDKLEELRHVAHIPRKTMYARKLRNTFSIQKYQGQYGIVQNNGQVCGGYSYDDILELESGYLRIKKHGKYGLIRITAQDSLQYIVTCKYDEIIDFKTYQGYMNRFTPYKEKFAWGKLGTHWQLLNEDGKICDPDCRGIQRP